MDSKVEVHLMAQGVLFAQGDRSILMSHPLFDDLAHDMAEAALNKKGYETVMGTADDVKSGDSVFGQEVMNVSFLDGSSFRDLHFGGVGESICVNVARILKIERPIS